MADPHKDKSIESTKWKSAYDAASTDFNLAIQLPLSLDGVDGYTSIKNYRDLAQQNLKMLIMTAPGERMMDPLFGVGLRNFLFEQNDAATHGELEARIHRQIQMYLPYIKILNVGFSTHAPEEQPEVQGALVHVEIRYKIKPLDIYEVLDLSVSRN